MQLTTLLRAAACFAALSFGAAGWAQTPAKRAAPLPPLTERMNEFPSLWQEDERAGFLGNGAMFCGPVAASNALLWLATHGYPKLLPGENGDTLYGGYTYATTAKTTKAQIALVHAITGDGFVKMKEGSGASPGYIARGVRAYVESKGYQVERLDIGSIVSDPPDDFPLSARAFSLEAVKEAFQKGAVVWIAVGWYDHDAGANTYTRKGGHFLTLVGYGKDASGNVDDSVLIVRNPARNGGRNYPNEFVRLHRMTEGSFAGREGAASKGRSIAGHFETVGGLFVAQNRVAILDNATILVLKPAAPAAP